MSPNRGFKMQTNRIVRMAQKASQHHRRNSFYNKHHDIHALERVINEKRDSEHEPNGCTIRSRPSKPH